MITLRELTLSDIPNLTQIHPTFRSGSVLDVVRDGEGLDVGWRLLERELTAPFDKGDGYDFDEFVRADVAQRLARPDDVYQRVADFEGRLIGLLEVELQDWNNTATLSNLMIDRDYQGKGLGRRLWHRAVDYARQADVRAILIETQNTNVPACKFYARMGCQLCGIHEAYYDGGSEEVAIFWRFTVPRKKV